MLFELLQGDTLRRVHRSQLAALRDAYDISKAERCRIDVIVIHYSHGSHVVCSLDCGRAYILRPAYAVA